MIKQKFSKSFEDVLTQAFLFQSELVIDQTAFTTFSSQFATPFATNFLADIHSADAIPTNEDDLNSQTLLSSQVEDKMVTAREQYQKLLLYVGFAWPDSDAMLKLFGQNNYLSARNVPVKMVNLLQGAYTTANSTAYKTTLTTAGFLQADITLLNTIATDLQTKINTQQDFIRHSFTRTEDRIVAYNKVWDSMAKISNASKYIFKDSPAKIEFYLLYPETGNGGGSLTKPANFAYDSVLNKFSWSVVANATSYEIEYSVNNIDWLPLWNGSELEYVYIPSVGILTKYRCRARNDNGFGDFCDPITITYYEPLPTPVSVSVTTDLSLPPNIYIVLDWSPVVGATFYKVFESVVGFGQPAGNFSDIGNFVPNTMRKLAVRNRRYYYHVRACNDYTSSLDSSTVMIDIPA